MILNVISSHIPYRNKSTSIGWTTFNCVACVHLGHRPDTRNRGGIIFSDGGFTYHCFNCGFKTGWRPGSGLSKKTTDLMHWLNVPEETIAKCRLYAMADNEFQKKKTEYKKNTYPLPQGAKSINDLIRDNYDRPNFIKVLEYIGSRNINWLDWYDLYYVDNTELSKHFIIPTLANDHIVGWAARNINDKAKQKYILQCNKQFIFNGDLLYSKFRKYCFIVEGQLDAISISGCATMAYEITNSQIDSFNSSDQIKIVVPDKDKDGKNFVEVALDQGWYVSFPEWPEKDAAQAIAKYGRIPGVTHILNTLYKTPLQIQLHKNKYFGV